MTDKGGTIEAVKKCPYCGEECFSRGLYLHVRNTDGNGHEPKGTVPSNFDPQNVEVSGYKETSSSNKFSGQSIRCKHCSKVFPNLTEATLHLQQAEGRGKHPATANPDTSLLAVPKQVQKAKPRFRDDAENPIAQYRRRYEQTTYTEEPMVPISELEDLLDEFRTREPEGAAWVKAAEKLDETIQPYRL